MMSIVLLVPRSHPVKSVNTFNDQQTMRLSITKQFTLCIPFLLIFHLLGPIFFNKLLGVGLIWELIEVLFCVACAVIDKIKEKIHTVLAIPTPT